MFKRSATSVWTGPGATGNGKVSTQSGLIKDMNYTFNQRFGDDAGTNPEELIAAAHAACFGMAFSFKLANAGMEPQELRTTATVTLDKAPGDWTLTAIHLDVKGKVSNGDATKFEAAAQDAKATCPISRVLNTNITVTATME
ncbi:MAG TPA: OsmC family protein [Candidatus Kapabacteria bacterium]|nr:OsmC family protein [Candidatus Kapabacteria bacterium]